MYSDRMSFVVSEYAVAQTKKAVMEKLKETLMPDRKFTKVFVEN